MSLTRTAIHDCKPPRSPGDGYGFHCDGPEGCGARASALGDGGWYFSERPERTFGWPGADLPEGWIWLDEYDSTQPDPERWGLLDQETDEVGRDRDLRLFAVLLVLVLLGALVWAIAAT